MSVCHACMGLPCCVHGGCCPSAWCAMPVCRAHVLDVLSWSTPEESRWSCFALLSPCHVHDHQPCPNISTAIGHAIVVFVLCAPPCAEEALVCVVCSPLCRGGAG